MTTEAINPDPIIPVEAVHWRLVDRKGKEHRVFARYAIEAAEKAGLRLGDCLEVQQMLPLEPPETA